jgi:broad specificity phosphatase PhoE
MENFNEKIIVLARHGQTDFNLEGKIQDPINPHLTEIGRQQARALGAAINNLGLSFDIIICADAKRNIETLAEIYPEYKKMANVKIDPRLQERYHKDLVGKTKKDIEADLGEKLTDRLSWHLYFEGTDKSKLTAKNYQNDESLDSIKNRITFLIEDLKNKKNILLIGSAIANQFVLEYLLHKTIGIQKPQFPEGNELDFQENNELRIINLDENMKIKNYSSKSY